jgi:PilZ domain
MTNANRRLQERKQPERLVFCKLDSEEGGSVLNLSEDGLCFENLTPTGEMDLLHLRLSVDVASAVEATGQLAWMDSTKRTGGLRFLELSAPAREQIRAWLSKTSAPEAPDASQAPAVHSAGENGAAAAASSGENQRTVLRKGDKQAAPGASAAEKSVIWEELHAPSMQLVPIERYRAETRAQFLRGVLVGFGIFAVVTIPVLWYSGGAKPSGPSANANRATQSSAEQSRASVAQPALPSASASEPATARTPAPLATLKTVSAPSPAASPQPQRPQASRASSSNPVARTSAPLATPRQESAERSFGDSASEARPLPGSEAAVVPGPSGSASESRPPSEQARRSRKVPATPQQLWSAVQAGNMKAAVALADLYARGEGVPVNCDQARVLLLVASEKKNAEAPKKLQELDKGGCPPNGH